KARILERLGADEPARHEPQRIHREDGSEPHHVTAFRPSHHSAPAPSRPSNTHHAGFFFSPSPSGSASCPLSVASTFRTADSTPSAFSTAASARSSRDFVSSVGSGSTGVGNGTASGTASGLLSASATASGPGSIAFKRLYFSGCC